MRSEKSPGSPLIRRNLPPCAAEASRLKGYLALPPEVHPARRTPAPPDAFTHVARSRRVRETVRLKKPYIYPRCSSARSDYIGWHYARVASPGPRRIAEPLGRGWNVVVHCGADSHRGLAASYSRPRFGAIDFFGHPTLSIPAHCPTQWNAGI